jgi:hypothetical protein
MEVNMRSTGIALFGAVALLASPASAHEIISEANGDIVAPFDIRNAGATATERLVTFFMELEGAAGSIKPDATGQLPGAGVAAYVWPTGLDPATVGFGAGSGILALAITAHPDFDDTPLFDENRDGDPANDGADWHSHWVVLEGTEDCSGGFKVRDVSPGVDLLPATAPHLPIALDSPGMSPQLSGKTARITVPVADGEGVSFDAVTAELRVHPEGRTPLLCVTGVHDVASGDLSLPGRVIAKE